MKYSLEQLDVYCYDEPNGTTAVSFSIPRAIGITQVIMLQEGRIRVVVAQSPDPAVAQVVPPMGRAIASLHGAPPPVVVAPEPPSLTSLMSGLPLYDPPPKGGYIHDPLAGYSPAQQAKGLDKLADDIGMSGECEAARQRFLAAKDELQAMADRDSSTARCTCAVEFYGIGHMRKPNRDCPLHGVHADGDKFNADFAGGGQ